ALLSSSLPTSSQSDELLSRLEHVAERGPPATYAIQFGPCPPEASLPCVQQGHGRTDRSADGCPDENVARKVLTGKDAGDAHEAGERGRQDPGPAPRQATATHLHGDAPGGERRGQR